jgi:hypothetical protein
MSSKSDWQRVSKGRPCPVCQRSDWCLYTGPEDSPTAAKPEALGRLADSLGLSVESLKRLGAGWSKRYSAWTFPMSDASGQVAGIRLRRLAVPIVVIVADADAPGQRGAENLASVLLAYCPAVRVIVPPAGVKDLREWKRRGATHADVQAAIDAAPVRRLAVQVRKAGGHHGR